MGERTRTEIRRNAGLAIVGAGRLGQAMGKSLLEAGIVIHTFIDDQTYTLDRVNDDQTALIITIVKMAAAHDYSKKLQRRIKSVWESRRAAMRAGHGRATNACPAWLDTFPVTRSRTTMPRAWSSITTTSSSSVRGCMVTEPAAIWRDSAW